MSRSKDTLAITVLTVLTIALPAPAGYRDYSNAISISGGEDHTLVVTANNWAWACGPNGHRIEDVTYYYGVLGTGSNDPDLEQKVLVRIRGLGDVDYLEGIYAIDAGWQHSLALDVNDSVWSWGFNLRGQLGIGNTYEQTTPVQVLRGDQSPEDPNNPDPNLTRIIAISAGRSGQHSLAVDANGYGYGWGYNEYGQCGNAVSGPGERELTPVYVRQGAQADDPNDANNPLERIVDICAGSDQSISLENDDPGDPNLNGCVYTWGTNRWGDDPCDVGIVSLGCGLLGTASEVNFSDTPVKVLAGAQHPNDPNQAYLNHIVSVAAGWDHCMALEKDDPYDPNIYNPAYTGRVFTWGA